MKKILFVHHSTGVGGAPISMIETIRALNPQKYRAEVLLLRDSVVGELLEAHNIPYSIAKGFFYSKVYRPFIHITPSYISWFRPVRLIISLIIWMLSRYFFASRLLSQYGYDIIHLNSLVLTDFLCAGAAKGNVVLHVREPMAKGTLGIRFAYMRSQIVKYADHVVAISEDNAARVGVNNKCTVVYNCTDIGSCPVSPNDIPKNIALYLGGDSEIKGFLTMVDCLDFLDVKVTVCFAGNYSQQPGVLTLDGIKYFILLMLSAKFRRIHAANKKIKKHPAVRFVGLSNNIPSLISGCSALVNPFSVEHFSRPIIEAFANGRPVIATRVDGIEEEVNHQVDGILVEKNCPLELASAINLLVSDNDLLFKFALNGFEKASKYFSPKNVFSIEHIYDDLLRNDVT